MIQCGASGRLDSFRLIPGYHTPNPHCHKRWPKIHGLGG